MLSSFPALVTVLALLLYVGVFVTAGRARGRYGIQAPAVTGAPEFERALRVQQNTLEQLIWFLPALWLFAAYVSPLWASIIGLVWIAGRVFEALAGFDKTGEGRIHPRHREVLVAAQQGAVAIGHQHDDRRVGAREMHCVAGRIGAAAHMAGLFAASRMSAQAAETVPRM